MACKDYTPKEITADGAYELMRYLAGDGMPADELYRVARQLGYVTGVPTEDLFNHVRGDQG